MPVATTLKLDGGPDVGDGGPLTSVLCEPLKRIRQGVLLPKKDVGSQFDCVAPVVGPWLLDM